MFGPFAGMLARFSRNFLSDSSSRARQPDIVRAHSSKIRNDNSTCIFFAGEIVARRQCLSNTRYAEKYSVQPVTNAAQIRRVDSGIRRFQNQPQEDHPAIPSAPASRSLHLRRTFAQLALAPAAFAQTRWQGRRHEKDSMSRTHEKGRRHVKGQHEEGRRHEKDSMKKNDAMRSSAAPLHARPDPNLSGCAPKAIRYFRFLRQHSGIARPCARPRARIPAAASSFRAPAGLRSPRLARGLSVRLAASRPVWPWPARGLRLALACRCRTGIVEARLARNFSRMLFLLLRRLLPVRKLV